jgi:Domain of unknown function (DUF5753)/Helix-turn-helix domain
MKVMHAETDLRLPRIEYEQAGPAVLRMLVGAHLRRLREQRGISRDDAGYSIRASGSKISRMELGRVALKERDVADLLTLYGVGGEPECGTVLALAKRASAPGWWRAFTDYVPSWFEPYLGLEQGASVLRGYEIQCIPGLLQTEDYARAIIRLGHRTAAGEEVEARVRLRMRRQQIVTRPDPARLWAIIDEGALHRPVGGRAVMRGQIQHLIDSAALPNVTIQVLPFSASAHAAAAGPIAILRFPEWDLPDVVYLEQLNGAIYPERLADLERYWDAMNRLVTDAEAPGATLELLRRILAET